MQHLRLIGFYHELSREAASLVGPRGGRADVGIGEAKKHWVKQACIRLTDLN